MAARLYGKDEENPVKADAAEAINAALDQITNLYAEAEALAIEHGLSFRYEGPAGYGDGGYYDPNDREDQWGRDNGGWHASSQSC